MLISSLEQMEKIVESRQDLEWEGWDVVKYTKNAASFMSTNGVFRNGSWYKRQVFPVKENGWSVPKSIGEINA